MNQPITVKLQPGVLKEAQLFIPKPKPGNRNAYINEAVKRMNRLLARLELAEAYRGQSELVRNECAEVLGEFESVPDAFVE